MPGPDRGESLDETGQDVLVRLGACELPPVLLRQRQKLLRELRIPRLLLFFLSRWVWKDLIDELLTVTPDILPLLRRPRTSMPSASCQACFTEPGCASTRFEDHPSSPPGASSAPVLGGAASGFSPASSRVPGASFAWGSWILVGSSPRSAFSRAARCRSSRGWSLLYATASTPRTRAASRRWPPPTSR